MKLEIIWCNTTNVYYENVIGFKVGKRTLKVKYIDENGKTQTNKHSRMNIVDFTLIQQGYVFDRNTMFEDDYNPCIKA